MPTTTGDDNSDGTVPRSSVSSGLAIESQSDHITTLTGESMATQREPAKKDKTEREARRAARSSSNVLY